jgi:hypothetical protein
MPALRTLLDGVHLATVSTVDYELVTVEVSGTRTDSDLAYLEIAASHHPRNEEATCLLWANHIAMHPGQKITVQFLENAETSTPGKTLDELYPREPAEPATQDFKPIPELLDPLAHLPAHRDSFALQLDSSQGTHLSMQTDSKAHGFRFSVFWNIWRSNPAQACMALCSHSLQNLRTRTRGTYHAQEMLGHQDEVSLTVLG